MPCGTGTLPVCSIRTWSKQKTGGGPDAGAGSDRVGGIFHAAFGSAGAPGTSHATLQAAG